MNALQDAQLRRILIPRTWVNKGGRPRRRYRAATRGQYKAGGEPIEKPWRHRRGVKRRPAKQWLDCSTEQSPRAYRKWVIFS
jgi:hypothetical protein